MYVVIVKVIIIRTEICQVGTIMLIKERS